ncbi:17337_t:CDS:1 [Funneliformis caledonium]|uniref:17337_t:CDS:1 n=1 Tax=Funneliformis caledonium TaxID=1117310 RepID=A0A9N9BCQ0_9GLOM|nr:17337_t:CDS:1 [Funneliformis caledonium]
MSQVIFDNLQPDQKTQVKWITFTNGNTAPSLSGFTLTIYNDHGNLQGSLSLAQFPNLRKIQFVYTFYIANLEEIDISENTKLNRVIISTDNQVNLFHNVNNNPLSCSLLAKEKQLNQVIVTYPKRILHNINNATTSLRWTETSELLKKQTAIPVFLIEDQKAEQQEAEIKALKQQIQEKDQQITNLTKQTEQTPTFKQFQELNEIALPSSELDFDILKKEIKRLRLKDFIPYYEKQKDDFQSLVDDAKNNTKEGLGTILDLLLQTQIQIIENAKTEDSFTKGQLQGQLNTCQALLQTNLSKEELKELLNKQNEQLKLEQQWASLQGNDEKTYFDEEYSLIKKMEKKQT